MGRGKRQGTSAVTTRPTLEASGEVERMVCPDCGSGDLTREAHGWQRYPAEVYSDGDWQEIGGSEFVADDFGYYYNCESCSQMELLFGDLVRTSQFVASEK